MSDRWEENLSRMNQNIRQCANRDFFQSDQPPSHIFENNHQHLLLLTGKLMPDKFIGFLSVDGILSNNTLLGGFESNPKGSLELDRFRRADPFDFHQFFNRSL
jgi:hypothetical protein